ncbi:hypothetical protein TSAR_003063 [Trichomalopsis sarcophagae]|uniref:Glycosylphosphatidylinositol anchor biosynthesis protein 11 n=1 Tax=Trichomalopsis sarcophagae TaxID=543379 RepID=A0A232F6R6_9HYME|nr:hypothetical protein TSAR_003063 [Trichomalopsis sarcophagae]
MGLLTIDKVNIDDKNGCGQSSGPQRILIYMHFSDNLYELGKYKFISILSTLVFAELIKLSFTSLQTDHLPVGKLEASHSTKSKKTLSKSVKDSLKFVLAIVGITIIYYIAIVLFGAPLLSHHEETSMLSLTLTALTLAPASLHLGVDNALALFTGSQLLISGAFVDAVKLNIKAVLLGTWLSAFVLPLDWDRPWQAWPIPCIVGALLGLYK